MRDIRGRLINNKPYFFPVLTMGLAECLRPGKGICKAQSAFRKAKKTEETTRAALGMV